MFTISKISSTALKSAISKSQLLKPRLFTQASIHLYYLPANKKNVAFQKEKSNELKNFPYLVLDRKFTGTLSEGVSQSSHDHSKIWNLERVLSLLMLPVVPAAIYSPCQQLDTVLALLIVMHTHFGLEAIVVDYIRPIIFGNLAPKLGLGLLYLLSIATLAGLLNITYNDCGLANAITAVWKT